MIEMSKALPSYRICGSCRGQNDVREIKVSAILDTFSCGTVIALCKDCREELIEVLKGDNDE